MQDLVESFSGIRGNTHQSMTPELCRRYGFTYGMLMKELGKASVLDTIVVGGDSRQSHEMLKAAVVEGLQQAGWNTIIDVGIAPTPAVQFAVRHFNAAGGCIITGSHTEAEFNGLKFLGPDGGMLRPALSDSMIAAFHAGSEPVRFPNLQKVEKEDCAEECRTAYIQEIARIVGVDALNAIRKKRLSVVLDPNGGSATRYLTDFVETFGLTAETINGTLGTFERLIEPKPDVLTAASAKVDALQADAGFAFDCDADRVELVIPSASVYAKKKSPMIDGQYILALLVDEVLATHDNPAQQTVVVNDATSNVVHDIAKRYGATIEEVEVGEINVVEGMEKKNSPVGGEGSSSGGIFPPSKCRDGLLTMAMILRSMVRQNKNLSDILLTLPSYTTLRDKLQCAGDKQQEVREKIEAAFLNEGFTIQTTGDATGGLKIIPKPGEFMWYRASKTEAGVFRIFAESQDPRRATELLARGVEVFQKAAE